MQKGLKFLSVATSVYKNIKDKPLFFNEWSKNYKPDYDKLNIKTITSIQNKKFDEHKTNIKACLAYGDYLYALSNNEEIKKFILNDLGIKDYYIINEANIPNALIIPWENNILVVFKGSATMSDIISDVNIDMTEIKDCDKTIKIHKGIYTKFLKSNLDLMDKLDNIIKTKKINNIFVTGHSLGAGLATLTSFYLSKKYSNMNIFNYSSGSMKIGNKEFIEEYDKKNIYTVLLINNSDMAHKFPGNNNYCHIKTFNSNKNPFFDSKSNIYNAHLTSTYYDAVDTINFD
jgi:hypothetical protein